MDINKEVKYIEDLFKLASARGTEEEEKAHVSREALDEMLNDGVLRIQAKIVMLEAYKAYSAGKPKYIKRVTRIFDKMMEKLTANNDK